MGTVDVVSVSAHTMDSRGRVSVSTENIPALLFLRLLRLDLERGVEMIVKTRTMKRLVFAVSQFALSKEPRAIGATSVKTCFVLIVCLWASQAYAQGTYKAATCNLSDVSSAIAAERAHPLDGDIISIPAGTCAWTTPLFGPTFTNSVTIQGAGAISATTGGAATTGTDQTIIIDHISGAHTLLLGIGVNSPKTLRVTGIAFIDDSGSYAAGPDQGMLTLTGSSNAVRADHCHFFAFGNGLWFAAQNGVIDHVFFQSQPGSLNNSIRFENGGGFASWAQGDQFGSSNFIFAEDNRFLDGGISDGHDGARFVVRFNTITVSTSSGCPQAPGGNRTCSPGQMYNHGVTNAPAAGVRAMEIYQNNAIQPVQAGGAGQGNPAFSTNSGTQLFWGNNVSQYRGAMQFGYTCRQDSTGCNYSYATTPTNWGYCGTAFGSSTWDGNTNSTGYPCLMQPGRGKGDLITGSAFPNIVNSTTGTASWPHNEISPVYLWSNTYTPSSGYSGPCGGLTCLTASGSALGGLINEDKDFYQQFGTFSKAGSFNGTAGVGQGSSDPSVAQPTCISNASTPIAAGSTWLGVPVSGNWGPGYWNTSNSTLYVCTAVNTWTAYYTPYTYPHPLTSGVTSGAGTSVAPPVSLQATVQ
jgi:hypothetical protein